MRLLICWLISFAGQAMFLTCAWAAINVYEFDDPVQEQRFYSLINELRCPKCQNQNLAGSDALLAKDLKDIVYEQIKAGRSDKEIMDFMQARYGDFILYRPPIKASTYLLWFGPFVAVLLAGWFCVRWLKNRASDAGRPMDEQEQQRLKQLLKDVEK